MLYAGALTESQFFKGSHPGYRIALSRGIRSRGHRMSNAAAVERKVGVDLACLCVHKPKDEPEQVRLGCAYRGAS